MTVPFCHFRGNIFPDPKSEFVSKWEGNNIWRSQSIWQADRCPYKWKLSCETSYLCPNRERVLVSIYGVKYMYNVGSEFYRILMSCHVIYFFVCVCVCVWACAFVLFNYWFMPTIWKWNPFTFLWKFSILSIFIIESFFTLWRIYCFQARCTLQWFWMFEQDYKTCCLIWDVFAKGR